MDDQSSPCGKYRRTGVDGGFIHEKAVLIVLPILSPSGTSCALMVLEQSFARRLPTVPRYVGRSSHAADFSSEMKYGVVSVFSAEQDLTTRGL